MPWAGNDRSRGFSLLELIIVIVIMGIIAAIAIPRASRASAGAADQALRQDLAILRKAIDLFIAEHCGKIPTKDEIADALTKYSNVVGDDFSDTKDAAHICGPYVRTIPPLPLGIRKGCTGISNIPAPGIGWIYFESDGFIRANTSSLEKDASGTPYRDY